MAKVLFLDCETTGVNPDKHSVIQIGAIAEVNGQLIEFSALMRPQDGTMIEKEALEIHGRTKEEIIQYPLPRQSLDAFRSFLGRFVDKFDRADKFIFAGYNANFDVQFLRKTFERDGDPYFGSWFFWPTLDVVSLLAVAMAQGHLNPLPNFKLATVCEHFGIELQAHDAMSDIKATRKLYLKLTKGNGAPNAPQP